MRGHTLSKVIGTKVDVIVRLVFELAFFEATVQYFNHYATDTLPLYTKWGTYYSSNIYSVKSNSVINQK